MPVSTNLTPNTAIALMQAAQADTAGSVKQLKDTARDAKSDAAIEASAKDFEAMFVSEMLKPMMDSVPVDETFGGGKGEDVFRDMMVQEYGKKIAQAGGIGLASHVKEALLKIQAEQNLPTQERTQ